MKKIDNVGDQVAMSNDHDKNLAQAVLNDVVDKLFYMQDDLSRADNEIWYKEFLKSRFITDQERVKISADLRNLSSFAGGTINYINCVMYAHKLNYGNDNDKQ